MKQQVKQYKKRNRVNWIEQMMDAELHLPDNAKKAVFLKHILEANKEGVRANRGHRRRVLGL